MRDKKKNESKMVNPLNSSKPTKTMRTTVKFSVKPPSIREGKKPSPLTNVTKKTK